MTSFIFVFGLLFLFIKIGLNASTGFMVHYATFMASRTYLVHDNNSNQAATTDGIAAREAKKVFDEILAQAGLSGAKIEFNAPSFGGRKVLVGARGSFKQKFSFTKLIGGGKIMNMISESYLGREPVRQECIDRTCDATTLITSGTNTCEMGKTYTTVYDNGC